jgi:hypothetical protein
MSEIHMRLPLAFTLASLSLAACGGGDDGGMMMSVDAGPSRNGFDPPPVTLKANMNNGNETDGPDWVELGDADLSCLNTPSTLQPTSVEVTLSTTVTDFESHQVVPGATVEVFHDQDDANPFQTSMSDTDTGAIQFMLPAGTLRFGYKITSDTALPTFLLNQKLMSPSEPEQTEEHIQSVSTSTANTLPALIGQTRIVGTGVVAGALRDCQNHEISGYVATMSSTPMTATLIDGAEAYYFDDQLDLPVNHRRAQYASKDGLFMIIQVPTQTSAYVQMWGYLPGAQAGGPMTLLSELQVPVLADTVITGSFDAVRSN